MENKTTMAETLQKVRILKKALDSLSELRDEAFFAFKYPSLKKMNEIFETSWEELFRWNLNHNEFVQNTGDFKFIFESPIVKQLIIDNLLKS